MRSLGAGGVALGFLVETGPGVLSPHGIVVLLPSKQGDRGHGHGLIEKKFDRLHSKHCREFLIMNMENRLLL